MITRSRIDFRSIFLLSLALLLVPTSAFAAWANWSWDWNTRVDGYGKTIGAFTTTPFPVDENSSSWTVTNEDGDKTFTVGTMAFVDNNASACGNGNNDYEPSTRTCGSGSEKIYTTIRSGLSGLSGSGNKTLLIRGGTDYTESSLSIPSGADSRHTWSLIGYGQERPTIAASSSGSSIINMSSYTLIQRLRVQNHNESNIFFKSDSYPYLIDIYSYFGNDVDATGSDGSLVGAGSDHAWLYHVTVDRTNAHCIKMSDGAQNSLTEFTDIKECGYWPGKTVSTGGHPSGYDYPDVGRNHELRYSRGITSLFYMLQVRGNQGYDSQGVGLFQIHDNEFADSTHFDDVSGEAGHDTPSQIIFNQGYLNKNPANEVYFYNNIVRDSSDNSARGMRVYAPYDNFYIFNNLFYGNANNELEITSTHSGNMFIYNNSFYDDDNNPLVDSGTGSDLTMTNNVFYQAGSGEAVSVGSADHSYNRYYFPNGSRGISLSNGETDGDPNWTAIPSGPFLTHFARPTAFLPGTQLTNEFNTDFYNLDRSSWNVGAIEFTGTDFVAPDSPGFLTVTPE